MAEARIELSDELLGAYADGELDPLARKRTERLLALDPAARRRLSAIRNATMIVRAAMEADGRLPAKRTVGVSPAATLSEAGEPSAEAGRDRAGRGLLRARGWLDWRMAASFVAGVLTLFAVTQLGGGLTGPAIDWYDNALTFHNMYLRARANEPPDTMLDILQHQPDQLAELISFPPSMPDLTAHGYEPAGAHVIAAPQGAILYVAFEGAERPPIGFAMTRGGSRGAGGDIESPTVLATRKGVTFVSWSTDSFDYGLSSELPASELIRLVDTARRSLP